ncbi:metalloregulator ArsR/SmtB family transcription factor [Pseudoflavitalea sp. X16]|uniref:metalloregulator ArsR/SmtB family transcription factor n=1 Tax=Paraflavitalea devenefica TaxID=2716334 RepID=UPI00141F5228|nr:metalloregulator ArsR/SmtB family transcription factor [Paraflavitalea devenefica]NII26358.1 metalloregulator ArsR/SmtB family transcription factor [Paraflavitalea devenefica]
MEKRIFKDKAYSMLATMIKAMANSHRLEIVDLLGQGEKAVEEIANETSMSIANTSQHLQVLKAANLVEIRREGNFIYYKLGHEEIYQSWQMLRELGLKHMAEMEKLVNDFREKRNSLEALKMDDLLKRIKSKNVVILDVRPETEFKNGHIPGAINIPVEGLATRLKKLPKNKEYVAYCRGPFCVFADEAVQILTQKGFNAKRLGEGFPDWKMKGLPVEIIEE